MQSTHKKETNENPLTTADLYELADKECIAVYQFPLPYAGSLALMQEDGRCFIGMNNDTEGALEHVRLGHEIGHCITGGFYNRHAPAWVRGKSEYKANKWAILNLCPLSALRQAQEEGITEIWSLAEYFNVPEDFMRRVLAFYENVQ